MQIRCPHENTRAAFSDFSTLRPGFKKVQDPCGRSAKTMQNVCVYTQAFPCGWPPDSFVSLGSAFIHLNSGCSSQHLLNLHFPIVVADSAVKSFQKTVGKMPLMFLDTSERSTTYGANCQSPQHISPKQKETKKVTPEAVNESTYFSPD